MSSETGESTSEEVPLEVLIQQAYNAAVRLLASRDHSTAELNRKLRQRDHSAEAIDGAVHELIELNYVNDARYAVTYAEQRLAKGYGPLSVRAKLRERGLPAPLIEAGLATQSVNWVELAQRQLEKRFDVGTIQSRDKREEARLARFLTQRGFSLADSLRALKASRKALQGDK